MGYAVVIFLAGLQAIPRELYEAATVDGAGSWARFPGCHCAGAVACAFLLILTSILAYFPIVRYHLCDDRRWAGQCHHDAGLLPV
ncbi:MAG: hypothetical protein R2856_03405 [Caldilineaceae bacterium]